LHFYFGREKNPSLRTKISQACDFPHLSGSKSGVRVSGTDEPLAALARHAPQRAYFAQAESAISNFYKTPGSIELYPGAKAIKNGPARAGASLPERWARLRICARSGGS
jgi:hypothetical protein